MGKNKKQKISGYALECVKNFKKSVEAAVKNSIYASSVKYEERGKRDAYILIANVEYERFEVHIEYSHATGIVDFKIHFDGSRYDFSIYDVFNYFDIADFDLYFYSDCFSKFSIDFAVNNIFSVCVKYIMSIENIAADENAVNALQRQLEADLNASFGDDDLWKTDDDELRISQDFLLPINYGSSKKALNTLKKYERKNGLETLYEKRLLKYLESGNEVHYTPEAKKKSDKGIYNLAKLKTMLVIAPLSAFIAFGMVFGIRSALYSGGYVFENTAKIVFNSFAAAAGMCYFLWCVFGKILIVKFSGDGKDKLVLEQFDKWFYERFDDKIKVGRAFFCVVALALSGICTLTAVEDIAFFDDGVKYIADYGAAVCTVKYEDLKIYRLEGYYSKGYYDYDNGYAVSNGDRFYELGNLEKGSEAESRLLAIAKKYNIEISEIKTVQDLDEY